MPETESFPPVPASSPPTELQRQSRKEDTGRYLQKLLKTLPGLRRTITRTMTIPEIIALIQSHSPTLPPPFTHSQYQKQPYEHLSVNPRSPPSVAPATPPVSHNSAHPRALPLISTLSSLLRRASAPKSLEQCPSTSLSMHSETLSNSDEPPFRPSD